jgi:hypothetical protein
MPLDGIIHNRTPFTARCVPMDDRHGRELLVVILKMAYDVSPSGRCRPLLGGAPVRLTDERVSGAAESSLRYPGDLLDDKPGADVILAGTARPPADRAVTEMDVSLRVETGRRTLQKAVRVHGPRVWYAGAGGVVPGPAARLAPTPLRYELAYGGADASDPRRPLVERRNPAGTGVAVDRRRLVGTPAPAIEDPARPLGSSSPAPAGFGPIAPEWSPRLERAGTYDEVWRRERAPLRPADFDPRHHCCSEPELWSEEPLAGDEAVEVLGATLEGAWRFRLPRHAPVVVADLRGERVEIRPGVDTLLIDADAGRVELVWRARVPRPRKLDHVRAIRVDDDGGGGRA